MANLILVVDDDALMRMQLRELLQYAGYEVVEANNGKEALAVYVQLQPDMVLLDALMDEVDGFTCCAQLRSLPKGKSTPILMVTGLADQISVEQAFAAGATDYITKPIHWQVLQQRVHRMLEAKRTMEELLAQTEQAKRREAQLVIALEAAQMGIWDWDIVTNAVTWSDKKESLFGLKKNSFEGTYDAFMRCVYPQDRDLVSDAVREAVDKRKEYDIEFRAVLPNGRIRWIASRGVVFRDVSGVAVGMSGVDMDITKRKQFEAALEVYANRQALVAELSQLALAGIDLIVLLEQAVNFIAVSLDVDYCKVLKLLPDGNNLLVQAGIGWHEGIVGSAIVSTQMDSQAGYILSKSEPVVVDDFATETRFTRPQLLTDHNVISGISLVIHGKDRAFGILGAHATTPRNYSRDEVYFLQAIANVLATAIERKHTETALLESQTRLKLINIISTSITSGMSVNQIIEITVSQISQSFPMLRVAYSTIDAKGILSVLYSIEPEEMPAITGLVSDLNIVDEYLQALRRCQPVIVADVTSDPRLAPIASSMVAEKIRAVLDVSLKHSEQLVGLLCFDSPLPRQWSDSEIVTLKEAADYLAVAIREALAQQERSEVVKALQESEQRWQLAVQGTNDGIWDWNVINNEVFFSTRWKEMLGYTEDEISGNLEEWTARIHPDDIGWVRQEIEDHFAKKTPFYIAEHRIRCKDGSYKWILNRGQARWDGQGNVIRMAGSHTDITERKLAEERLRQSEERFQIMARATNDAVWDWDLLSNRVWWNESVQTLFGYSVAEARANATWWRDRIHPDDRRRIAADMQAVIDSGMQVWANEYRFQRADQTFAYIFDRGYVVHDPTGKPVRMIGAIMDISERKRVQEELQRQNMRSQLFADFTLKIRQSLQIDEILNTSVTEVQKLLHSDRVLILRLRSDSSVVAVQEATVPGLPSLLGRDINDPCFSDEYVEKYRLGSISAIANIETANIQPCHAEFLQKFSIKANLVVPILLKNKLWGLLIAHQCSQPRDWTDWEVALLRQLGDQIGIALAQAKLLEQETLQREELARSNEELQQFAFIASHDLQEPLRKIKAFGDRLKSTCHDALSEPGRDYLGRMQNAAERMQALIDDLLTLSRVTTRAQPFTPANLQKIAEEVLSDLEIRISQTEAKIELAYLPTINADPLQMRQLLQNLIGNALKFHRSQTVPIVRIYSQMISAENETQLCQLVVEDNGIGFDEKYCDRIFQVFQRLHGRSEYEGTGIGLAICRKIVERHQGSIIAQSKIGQGAKFIVTLPMVGA
jgi:PAS domain S-box-containing protein